MPRIVGVTATRLPLTDEQRAWLAARLADCLEPDAELHHGCCVGGDREAHVIATRLGYRTVGHPPIDNRYRSDVVPDLLLPRKPYLERDRDVVDACTVLVAVPSGPETAQRRSGTWWTVRYARRVGCPTRNWWYER